MASQQQFEGPVLEDLLQRVRSEVGPGARIVAANRVRKGGVGGFFARQAFEVLVETADASSTATHQAGPASTPGPTQPSSVESRAPATILELADAVSADERNDIIDLVEERTLSTQTRDFAEVLDRFSRAIDATAEELGRDPDPAGATPGTSHEIDLRVTDRAVTAPAEPTAAADAVPDGPAEPARRPVDDQDVEVTSLATTATSRAVRPVTARSEMIDRYETRLSKLGLPARLIPRGVAPNGLKGALVESLVRLPPAPNVPAAVGVVIATVGVGAAPVMLARDLATELGLDPDDVMLATRERLGGGIPAWLQLCDAPTAQERRLSWRRRTRPTIVACSLPSATGGLRWAKDILDHLEPTVTWAIVDAGWKREDIAYRIEELGGVDVLAL
ncbi:MAG TPA: hypothetical protein VK771_07805, partial [Acidimicrobiia bacterium]|nr:hypothetical protein [Acidimicrobiia bacterium]